MNDPSVVYFYSPPGWPSAAPGVLPPAGWQPDPSFPAPPAGWIYYRNAEGVPVDAPAGAWRPPAFAPVVSAAVPATTHAPLRPRGRRPLVLVLSVVVVALVAVGAFFLWPRPPQLSTEQFAKLATSPTLAEMSTSAWEPYHDGPPDFSNWGDPAPLSACEATRPQKQRHLLREHGGGFVDADIGGGFSVELWTDRNALGAARVLEDNCSKELAGAPASLRDKWLVWDEWRDVDRGRYETQFRSAPGGIYGFSVRVENVHLAWLCSDGRRACASEAELDQMASVFAEEVAAAAADR